MTAPRAWSTGCVLGLAAVFLTSLAAWLFPLGFLVAIGVWFVGFRRSALSGYLVGFGVVWVILVSTQLLTGGHLDNQEAWLAVGITPIVVGGVLGLAAMRER